MHVLWVLDEFSILVGRLGGGVVDPIAYINYTDAQGYENIHPCYDMATLEIVTTRFKQRNYMFFVCMTSVVHPLPTKRPERRLQAI